MKFGPVLTYKDIDAAKGLIGKRVEYSDNLRALDEWTLESGDTLLEVNEDSIKPFLIDTARYHADRKDRAYQFIREVLEDEPPVRNDYEHEINKAIGEIAEHYGVKAQSMQTCEECAELIQAVSKLTRGETSARVLSLIEEIADVRIMMSQLMYLYGIPESEITNQIEEKLKRQFERIRRNEMDVKPE